MRVSGFPIVRTRTPGYVLCLLVNRGDTLEPWPDTDYATPLTSHDAADLAKQYPAPPSVYPFPSEVPKGDRCLFSTHRHAYQVFGPHIRLQYACVIVDCVHGSN